MLGGWRRAEWWRGHAMSAKTAKTVSTGTDKATTKVGGGLPPKPQAEVIPVDVPQPGQASSSADGGTMFIGKQPDDPSGPVTGAPAVVQALPVELSTMEELAPWDAWEQGIQHELDCVSSIQAGPVRSEDSVPAMPVCIMPESSVSSDTVQSDFLAMPTAAEPQPQSANPSISAFQDLVATTHGEEKHPYHIYNKLFDVGLRSAALDAIGHRDKLASSPFPFNACVARPVNRAEIRRVKAAAEAVRAEWKRLRDKHVWDETVVREWDEVAAEARAKGEEVNFGHLFCICVEKNSELAPDNPKRKYKGRVVFQGNRVTNQNWEAAIFQDLGSSPATMDAGRAADAYGCIPGHTIEVADAEQAYIQADLSGTPTWVCIPPEDRPASWAKFKKPVVLLKKALYGHPDSGTFWERHCDAHVREVGFEPVGEEWMSCYFHPSLKLFLVIYVDDFKMAGPTDNLKNGWELLRNPSDETPGLVIEDAKPVGLYLGCNQEVARWESDRRTTTTLTYNMQEFLESCVARYLELAGPGVKLKHVRTPFLSEEPHDADGRRPQPGPDPVECPWCKMTFSASAHPFDLKKSGKSVTSSREGGSCAAASSAGGTPPQDDTAVGRLQPIAAKILMKVLYAARLARFDLLRAVCHLACFVTKWSPECDRKLHRLMCYINSSLHLRMVGWIRDTPDSLQPHLYADADFAGCTSTLRSTSGYHFAVRGPGSCFPVAGVSKRQGCVSHSTPEAEIVAGDTALRLCGLPFLTLWAALLPNKVELITHEDNQAMINVVRTGRNPTMRYIGRTHGVSVAWLHERFKDPSVRLIYEKSDRMCADIYTKAFTQAEKWDEVCELINVIDPKRLDAVMQFHAHGEEPRVPLEPLILHAPPSGGNTPSSKSSKSLKPKTKTGDHVATPSKVDSILAIDEMSPSAATEHNNDACNECDPNNKPVISSRHTPLIRLRRHEHELMCNLVSRLEPEKRYGYTDEGVSINGDDNDGGTKAVMGLNRILRVSLTFLGDWTGIAYLPGSREISVASCGETFIGALVLDEGVECECLEGNGSYRSIDLNRCFVHFKDRSKKCSFVTGHLGVIALFRLSHLDKLSDSSREALKKAAFPTWAPSDSQARWFDLRGTAQEKPKDRKSKGSKKSAKAASAEYRVEGGAAGADYRAIGGGDESSDQSNISEWRVVLEKHASTLLANSRKASGTLAPPCARRLVEACCNEGSLLASCSQWSEGCEVIAITERDDLTSPGGIRLATDNLRSASDALWFSCPCTGGSSWQKINRLKGPETVALIEGHWRKFRKLWAAFERIAVHAIAHRCGVFIEWPRQCEYWRHGRVQDFLRKFGFAFTEFDGCMFGLAASFGPDAGKPIYKPWKVAFINSSLGVFLNMKCDRSHEHARCAGKDTQRSEGYTPQIARCVHSALRCDAFAFVNAQSHLSRTVDCACAPVLSDSS